MNVIKFPSAKQAKNLSEAEKVHEWSLLETASLIRSSVMAAAEVGETSAKVLLSTKLDSMVENLISKTLRKYGYEVDIDCFEEFKKDHYTKRTFIHIRW